MKAWPAIFLFAIMLCGVSRAEDFTPPQAYPISRYESGWQKNPFTLKTAPPAVQRDSFAKDLALNSIVKRDGVTTVTVINTKTRTRTRLRDNEPDSGGIRIKSVHLEDRKDTFVVLEEGSESATLRYDEKIIQSLAAAQGAPGARPGVPGSPMVASNNPGGVQPPGMGGGTPPPIGHTNGASPFPSRPALPRSGAGTPYVPTPQRRMMLTAPVPTRSH